MARLIQMCSFSFLDHQGVMFHFSMTLLHNMVTNQRYLGHFWFPLPPLLVAMVAIETKFSTQPHQIFNLAKNGDGMISIANFHEDWSQFGSFEAHTFSLVFDICMKCTADGRGGSKWRRVSASNTQAFVHFMQLDSWTLMELWESDLAQLRGTIPTHVPSIWIQSWGR